MSHVMIDLETLGTGYDAAIVAIGAVQFDPHAPEGTLGPTFYERITVNSALAAGTLDASTLLWWMEQSDAARRSTFSGPAKPLLTVLAEFNRFIVLVAGMSNVTSEHVHVWGNGATFDNVVLRSAFRAAKLIPTWGFRFDRCYRTLANLLPAARRPPFVNYGVPHNALDDAIAQARHLQKVYAALGLSTAPVLTREQHYAAMAETP